MLGISKRALKLKNIMTYLVGVLICLGLGIGSGLVSQHSFEWYHQLTQPALQPPEWIFAPIWTLLYILMGVVLGHLYLYPTSPIIWCLFSLQLLCNIIWSPLFFYANRINLALIDLFILFGCLITWLIIHRHQSMRLWLFIPYTLWTGFALYLNMSLYFLNSTQ